MILLYPSTSNATGIYASAQFALAFPTLKSVVPPSGVAELKAGASKLVSAPGLSPLTKAQYEIQLAWMTAHDVAYLEYIMFPGGGRTSLAAAPNATYITIYNGLMVCRHSVCGHQLIRLPRCSGYDFWNSIRLAAAQSYVRSESPRSMLR